MTTDPRYIRSSMRVEQRQPIELLTCRMRSSVSTRHVRLKADMDTHVSSPTLAHWMIILALGAIWGSAFMAMELALDGFGPLWVAALRTGLAVPALLIVASIGGHSMRGLSENDVWRFVVPAGVFGMALPFFLLSWGQQYVPSAFAGIAMGSLPIVLVPLAYLLLPEEELSLTKVLGLLIGFLGLVLLVGPGALGATSDLYSNLGRLACIGATVGYAIASVVTRRSPPVPALVFSCGALMTAALILLPLALVFEGVPSNVPSYAFAAILYAAIFPTALAAYWRVLVVKSAGSVFMSLVAYLVPVFSVIFGVALLDEDLMAQTYFALLLILAGIAVSQAKALWMIFRPTSKRT